MYMFSAHVFSELNIIDAYVGGWYDSCMTFGIDQDPRLNSKYTDEIAHEMCELIRGGMSIKNICKQYNINLTTFFNWKRLNPAFASLYLRAREDQAGVFVDEIIGISDDTSKDDVVGKDGETRQNSEWINRSKLKIESRKWVASMFAPKEFGNNMDKDQGQVTVIVKNNVEG